MEVDSLSYYLVMVHRIFKSRWCHVSELESNEAWAKLSRLSRDLTLAQLEFVTFPNMDISLSLLRLNSPMFLLVGTLFRGGNIPPPPHLATVIATCCLAKTNTPFANTWQQQWTSCYLEILPCYEWTSYLWSLSCWPSTLKSPSSLGKKLWLGSLAYPRTSQYSKKTEYRPHKYQMKIFGIARMGPEI